MTRGMRSKTAACVLLALGLMAGAAAGADAAAAGKVNMGYLYFGNSDTFIRQVDASGGSLNRVSPTLFDVTAEGGLQLVSDPSALAAAMKNRGVKVVPFLSNHWDRDKGRRALANREALTTSIAEAVVRYHLDGVNVDLENLTDQDRADYTDLVRLLRAKLPAGTELSVAIAANPSGWTKGWQASYDVTALAPLCDYLMLMSYDESWDGDPTPGPVASLPWVDKSVQTALRFVPSDKLLLGVPFYGRYWKEGADGAKGAGISNRAAEALAQRLGITPKYDEVQQSATYTFTVTADDPNPPSIGYTRLDPGTYTVWFDNERSMKKKLDLVAQYNLKGVGSWALGQESPDMWAYFSTWLNGIAFRDTAGHWAENEIRSAARNGWMTGTGASVFGPEESLTRAQAAAILVRAMKLADRSGADGTAGRVNSVSSTAFRDVPSTFWGAAEIALARQYGLVDGFPDGTFGPDQPVTREQLAAMFYRAMGSDGEGTAVAAVETAATAADKGVTAYPWSETTLAAPAQSPLTLAALTDAPVEAVPAATTTAFRDMLPTRWSWGPVSAMQEQGLLQGYADGTFRPEAKVSRAEAAVLLTRCAPELAPSAEASTAAPAGAASTK